MSSEDIKIPESTPPDFDGDGDLKSAIEYSRTLAANAHDWYARERKIKRFFAKSFRLLAILATAKAGLIPLLTQIGEPTDWYHLSPGWSSVALAVAGTLILFDKFFGFSTGWLRFTNAMTQIRLAIYDFDMGLKEIKLGCAEGLAEKGETGAVMERCRTLAETVNRIVTQETQKWDNEFRKMIQKVDEAVKRERSGALETSEKKALKGAEKPNDDEGNPT